MDSVKFSINTLGCKTNQSESDYIKKELIDKGYSLVSYSDNPDFCIVNTCTVTSQSDRKTRQITRRIRLKNPDCIMIVTGCYVVFNREFLLNSGVDCIVKNRDKYSIPSLIEGLVSKSKDIKVYVRAGANTCFDNKEFKNAVHSRALVKIQDGCEQSCSYCIVPMVRGGYKSMPCEFILKQIKNLEATGFDEVVLTGIHIGKYGIDFNSDGNEWKSSIEGSEVSNLADLLGKIIESTAVKRIRLGSIEINEIDNRIINLIMKSGRFAPHLHIPLQSGSDKILKLMGRPYSRNYFLKKVEAIRKFIPNIAITTDVMVGFPYEEEEDFAQTIDLIRRVSFCKLHVFKYSQRMHTEAARMTGQVSEKIKSERSRILRKIGDKLRSSYIRKSVGKVLEVVIEKLNSENGILSGTSENYIRVYFPLDKTNGILKKGKLIKGKIIKVLAESIYKDGLWGKLYKI